MRIQIGSSKIGSNLLHAFDIALGKTIVDRDILPLDEAILDQAGLELLHQMRPRVADDRENPRAHRYRDGEVMKKDNGDG